MKDNAHAFRAALIGDRMKAERLLKRYPGLIDYPVYGDSESALHFFAVENQIDVVNWLLARGANPQGVAGDDSPLHNAAQLGHEDVCRALLKAGSDPNRPDDGGETALHKASAHGYVRVIELLLAYGADPAVAEACGQLPVDMALPRKRDEVRAVFVRHADREPHTSPTRSSP
ncbi:MAG: ankyrin repeat domain-containing protein [Acidobacteriota bacterium]